MLSTRSRYRGIFKNIIVTYYGSSGSFVQWCFSPIFQMEELSAAEYARLTAEEKRIYLAETLAEVSDSAEKNYVSDSDDEDWFPVLQEQAKNSETSDHEETEEVYDYEDAAESEEETDEEIDSETEGRPTGKSPESSTTFIAKDKTIWTRTATIKRETAARNIIRQRSGPHRDTETLSIADTFKVIFTGEMVDVIVRHTNKKASRVYRAYNEENPKNKTLVWKELTSREFYGFLGILITSGVNNSNLDDTIDMWRPTSYPLYRAAMGINRFWNILRFIRFDDPDTRGSRIREDRAAPVREIWTMLNSNLGRIYKPAERLTIDEQLFPYRGRTRFTQYVPSKPAKYGIKVWWIRDAENAYPLRGEMYTGKTATGREANRAERVVKDLVSPYKGSGRNISMDKSLTTLPLAKFLTSWNLTVVGALGKTKKYIPSEMAASKSRELHSTLFGFHENVTICSYVPKKNKAVVLLSTMHADTTVRADRTKTPEIVEFYNKTKIRLDTMDQMLGRYTTKRRTSRWPLAFFYNILDVASLAAYILYYENNKMIKKRTNERRCFLRQLGEELCMPSIEDRTRNSQVMRHLMTKIAIESVFGKAIGSEGNASSTSSGQALDNTGRKIVVGACHICYKGTFKKRRKTRKSCEACRKPVCNEHTVTITRCNECTE